MPATRPRLSRSSTVAAALEIADWEGLDGLTIRKLAARLQVTPMAIYRHFRNKAEIVDALLDAVIALHKPADHDEAEAAVWVTTTFVRIRMALLAHPGVMPTLGTAASLGVSALQVMERVMGRLRVAGFDNRAAANGFYTLLSYTIGFVAIEGGVRKQLVGLEPSEQLRRSRIRFESLPPRSFPSLVDSATELADFPSDEQFVAGLSGLVEKLGLIAR